MTKLRKQRRRKTFRHNVNRKRLRNKLCSVGHIECKEVKDAWESSKSMRKNMLNMGLSYDPNETIKIPNIREKMKASLTSNVAEEWNVDVIEEQALGTKLNVAQILEKEAKAPRAKMFRLPAGQVEWITYLMDKHGSDYKAMAKDRKNYNQETWKQIRAKINRFKAIPEQYFKYLSKKGITEAEESSHNEDSDEDLY